MMILLAILAAIALAFIVTTATWKNIEGKIYARGVQPTMIEFGYVWLLFPILVIVIAIVLVIILS